MSSTAATNFADAWASTADVEGWMTNDQARRLWDRASELGSGARIVEIGSFRGRSMIILASAAPQDADIVAIDPHLGTDRGPQEIVTTEALGNSDHDMFNRNLAQANVADRVRHVRKMSDEALDDVEGAIDLLYIDGAHRYGPARSDMVSWGAKVVPGGTLLVHDSWSSIGVTGALLRTYLTSDQWRYIGRSQSMAEYKRIPVQGRNRFVNALRQLGELGWFIRNVVIKVLLSLKLGKVTKVFGHDGKTWPY